MIALLKWAWRFDLLWWLAKRYDYQYEYCYLFWRWWYSFVPSDKPKSKSSSVRFNPNAADMYAHGRMRRATIDDDDGIPADMWREYGASETESH